MGTGASKKATADAEKASFDDDDTDEDFDTYSKKKVAENSKSFSRHSVTMFSISVRSKFLIWWSRGEVSLVEQDTFKNGS